jgi:hypothetical protein
VDAASGRDARADIENCRTPAGAAEHGSGIAGDAEHRRGGLDEHVGRDWSVRYSPDTSTVEAINERVTVVAALRRLGSRASLVVCAIDSPNDVHLLVNEACFDLGVPYVTGGLQYSTLFYWSVEPGVSPCRLCLELNRADEGVAMADLADREVVLPAGRGEPGDGADRPVAGRLRRAGGRAVPDPYGSAGGGRCLPHG